MNSIQDTKTYKLIVSLSKQDRRRLQRFIGSAYFNQSEILVRLFEIILAQIDGVKVNVPSKEEIWFELKGGTAYNDGNFRKILNDLLLLVEEFFIYEKLDENPQSKLNLLFDAILERKSDLLYNSVTAKSKDLYKKKFDVNSNFYYYKYRVEKKYFDLHQKHSSHFGWGAATSIQHIAANLDHFYLSEKLKYYLEVLSRKVLLTKEDPIFLMDEIMAYVGGRDYAEHPLIRVYYLACKFYLEPDGVDNYFECKELLAQNLRTFSMQDLQDLYAAVLNFCVGQTNRGKNEFNLEYVQVYDYLLKSELLYENGELSPWKFKNSVLLGLRSGQLDWVEKLLSKYGPQVAESQRENTINYNTALLRFYQKRFEEVLLYLRDVEHGDLNFILSSKALLLSTYFELSEWEPLNYLIDSFRAFLNRSRKELSEIQFKSYINLLNTVKKIAKIKSEDKEIDTKLYQQIVDNNQIFSKTWLLEKVEKLK